MNGFRCQNINGKITVVLDRKKKRKITIPSELYPVNANKVEVFSSDNSKIASEKILEAFDKTEYKMGCCYSNSDQLASELNKAGISAAVYVGWVFASNKATPFHHAWVMCDGSLLDLSDDHKLMCYGKNGEQFIGKSEDECRELVLSFQLWAKDLRNSERCYPVGKVLDMLYVGSPCSGEEGKEIFSRLWDRYPNHPSLANGTDKDGYSPLQRLMKERGII